MILSQLSFILVLLVTTLLYTAHVSDVVASTILTIVNILSTIVYIKENIKCTLLRIVLTVVLSDEYLVNNKINNQFVIFFQ